MKKTKQKFPNKIAFEISADEENERKSDEKLIS